MKNIILVYIQIIYSISLILTSSSTSHISITIALAILTAIFLLGGEIDDRDIFCGKNTVHHFSKQIISSSSHGLVLAGETYDANSISKKSSSSKNQCEHSQGPKPDEIVSQDFFSDNNVQDFDMMCSFWIEQKVYAILSCNAFLQSI